jgi:hypothetical protein
MVADHQCSSMAHKPVLGNCILALAPPRRLQCRPPAGAASPVGLGRDLPAGSSKRVGGREKTGLAATNA